jgi:hypothetical protein
MMKIASRRRVQLALGAGFFALSVLVAVALWSPSLPDADAVRRSAVQIALVSALSAGALLLPGRFALPAFALVLVGDLAAANSELLGLLPRAWFASRPSACVALDESSAGARRDMFRVLVDQQHLDFRDLGWPERRVFEFESGKRNLVQTCGYRESVALSSFDPVAEVRLWKEVSPMRMLRALSTRFVLTSPAAAASYGGRIRATAPHWRFALVELEDVPPLLFRPDRVEQMAEAQLPRAAHARSDLLGAAVATLHAPPSTHLPDPAARLIQYADEGDRVSFEIDQEQPGYWMLSATLDADWSATVDGSPSAIVRGDWVRRAVWLPAGRHRVEFVYRPLLPLFLFLISLILYAGLLVQALAARSLGLKAPAHADGATNSP